MFFNKNEFGAITIASNLDIDNNKLEYAVAFCSPKDEFTKKIGRELAISRLESKDVQFYRILPVANRPQKYHNLRLYILGDILANMKYPYYIQSLLDVI